ncbi:MAG: VOC family protein [Gammaproteobacteria bacterium]
MIKPKAIDHLVLRTERPERLIDFYCQVLGCVIERKLSDQAGLVQLRAGSALIDIVNVSSELGRPGGPAPEPSGNNLDHFCLQIEPADEQMVINYLRQQGVACGEFKERYGAQGTRRSLYLQDSDGNNVELVAADR